MLKLSGVWGETNGNNCMANCILKLLVLLASLVNQFSTFDHSDEMAMSYHFVICNRMNNKM